MLSLRCRINANVAELLVIIGYSELGPTLGARPFALAPPPLARPPASAYTLATLASSPVWSFSRLPRCCDSHWRASRWTAPISPSPGERARRHSFGGHSFRAVEKERERLALQTLVSPDKPREQLSNMSTRAIHVDRRVLDRACKSAPKGDGPTPLAMLFISLFPTRCFSPRRSSAETRERTVGLRGERSARPTL